MTNLDSKMKECLSCISEKDKMRIYREAFQYKKKIWQEMDNMAYAVDGLGEKASAILLVLAFISNFLMWGCDDGDIGLLGMMVFIPLIPFAYFSLPDLVKRRCIRNCQKAEREYIEFLESISSFGEQKNESHEDSHPPEHS